MTHHPTQQAILESLRVLPTGGRYADLRPADLENDLYNYHLQQLVRRGHVEKAGDRYILTPSGAALLMELNPVDASGQSQRFKLAAMCLVLRPGPNGPSLLYQRRTRLPFAGQRAPIGGGMMRGEPATAAAQRRLLQEGGLIVPEPTLVGLIRKYHYDPVGSLMSDILFHVCLVTSDVGEPVSQNEFGEHYWVSIAEAVRLEHDRGSHEFAEWIADIAHAPAERPLFYFEERHHANPA